MLNLDLSQFESNVDPDQLVYVKPAYYDTHCFMHWV